MEYFIYNITEGWYCNDGKFRKNICRGTSSFCVMAFGCARIAKMIIVENKGVNLDVVVSEEYLISEMNKQLLESMEKALNEANKNKKT